MRTDCPYVRIARAPCSHTPQGMLQCMKAALHNTDYKRAMSHTYGNTLMSRRIPEDDVRSFLMATKSSNLNKFVPKTVEAYWQALGEDMPRVRIIQKLSHGAPK